MPLVRRFSEFLADLQQLEKGSLATQAGSILDAFTRHTPFAHGALYLREGRETSMRLAAKSQQCVAPEILDRGDGAEQLVQPKPDVLLPLQIQRENLGLIALAATDVTSDEDVALARAAGAFVSALISNQRLQQEAREGDFQLKYRLWELESLYDIGLSIASTLNIDELADEILYRTISLTNARRAVLYLREGSRFKPYRSFGDIRQDFLDSELATQLEKGAPLSFNDGTDCIFPSCSAFVAVPIQGNNEIIGVLAAADRETRDGSVGEFEPNELRLLSLFASQVGIALENARLHKEALEKQAMERELELAATIQNSILPKGIPIIEGIELAKLHRPARQVGGDYHAFFERDGILTILVADVSGKSVGAALLVSSLHAALQLMFGEGRELGEIATELNKHIHRWSAENKFITLIMVSIDTENETLQFVNAGHNPCYLMNGTRLETLKSHGLPIGILPNTRYSAQTRPFPAGSAVVLYSDGITEAEDITDDEFGNQRLEEVLTASATASADEIRDRIAEAVRVFVGEAPQKDDETLVIARRT